MSENKFIGFLEFIIINPLSPSPLSNLACNSGPALAIATIVSLPIASTISWNF